MTPVQIDQLRTFLDGFPASAEIGIAGGFACTAGDLLALIPTSGSGDAPAQSSPVFLSEAERAALAVLARDEMTRAPSRRVLPTPRLASVVSRLTGAPPVVDHA